MILVEQGESILENGVADFSAIRDDFVECMSGKMSRSSECELERASLERVLDDVLQRFNFQSLTAELQSLRLVTNRDASLARDSFVQHLRAWRNYVEDLRYSMPTSREVYDLDFDFVDRWLDISTDEISTTFDVICSSLGNAQPANSDDFRERIIDICDE